MKPMSPPPATDKPVNWDRVLLWSAAAILIVTAIGLASRRRTLLVAAELIDFVIVVGLLCLAVYALVAKSKQKPKSK